MMQLAGLLAVVLVVPAASQEVDGERVFRAMEKRLENAKTCRFSYALSISIDGREDNLKGTIWLGENNRARIEANGTFMNKNMEMLMVTDGFQTVARATGQSQQPARDTARGAGDLIRGTIARAGVFAGLFYSVTDKKDPAPDDLFTLSDFKPARKEMLDNREVLVFEYKIAFYGAKDKALVTIMIDSLSQLPARRIVNLTDSGRKVQIIEIYRAFEIDGRLDEKLFELPK